MKNTNLMICDAIIHPGETANLALPLPEYYSCTNFYMPIKVIHGKQAGPCLLIFAGVNGDELNGIEIINRLLKTDQLKNIRGTLIAVPVLNVFGLINNSNSSPYETNLEQCFPGNSEGSYGERTAEVFTREILAKASYCLEIRTGQINHDLLPQIYCDLDQPESKRLARQFLAPVINHVKKDHSLRKTADDLNIPLLVYKAGEARRFDEAAIHLGIKGIINIMQSLDMADVEEPKDSNDLKPVFSQDQDWIRAHRSGMVVIEVELGQFIKKRQIIGRIIDPFCADAAEPIKANQDGVIVGINRNPLIHEGQSIFKIASFIDNNQAEITLEAWSEQQEAIISEIN
ncbi:succinylglutamate desuccinylase/aspartoacylase [Legionella busanensis]|uniref:Succinylglutamate desuccinylase/aspartoacylase n=1 Tax=Legionella busanensis TaxID=190655 RepID=A0A378JLR4_9GAMM|nr:succinylglutamate desuccinylase/aspartoacylase family protein [Legionella busanensis]STX51030.1 succinylglutamate desuccinylase/aspartoacylase [Legionella busanensis]